MTNSGTIQSTGVNSAGIVGYTDTLEGTGSVTNSGTIEGGEYGIFATSDDAKVTTNSGVVAGSLYSIQLAGLNSTLLVQGSARVVGTIEGTAPANGNVLKFELTGLTTTQNAAFKAYVSTHTSSGTYTVSLNGKPATYMWADFANVTAN